MLDCPSTEVLCNQKALARSFGLMNPRLIAINGSLKGNTFPLDENQITIGRESANGISLAHSSVSRRHCLIKREGDVFVISDLDSFNGTFVNGVPVKEQILVH